MAILASRELLSEPNEIAEADGPSLLTVAPRAACCVSLRWRGACARR